MTRLDMMSMRRAARKGFTLLEVLIVVTIIAILALIVIRGFAKAGRRANEAAMRADLRNLRSAVQSFEADCGGYPPVLADMGRDHGSEISADQDGGGRSIDKSAYAGPYMHPNPRRVPDDPFTDAPDWAYDNATGDVHSSSTLTALDGSHYSDW